MIRGQAAAAAGPHSRCGGQGRRPVDPQASTRFSPSNSAGIACGSEGGIGGGAWRHSTRCSAVSLGSASLRGRKLGLAPGSVQSSRPVLGATRSQERQCRRQTLTPAWPRRSLRGGLAARCTAARWGTFHCPHSRISRAVAMPLRCCDTVQVCTSYGGIAGQRARC